MLGVVVGEEEEGQAEEGTGWSVEHPCGIQLDDIAEQPMHARLHNDRANGRLHAPALALE
jgi:hypothetical protein